MKTQKSTTKQISMNSYFARYVKILYTRYSIQYLLYKNFYTRYSIQDLLYKIFYTRYSENTDVREEEYFSQ